MRLPGAEPIRVLDVSTCRSCPWFDDMRKYDVCAYNGTSFDDDRAPKTPPDWCPLRRRPTLVRLRVT